jgi:hypothetical protein
MALFLGFLFTHYPLFQPQILLFVKWKKNIESIKGETQYHNINAQDSN